MSNEITSSHLLFLDISPTFFSFFFSLKENEKVVNGKGERQYKWSGLENRALILILEQNNFFFVSRTAFSFPFSVLLESDIPFYPGTVLIASGANSIDESFFL